jgi:hypothetical protein
MFSYCIMPDTIWNSKLHWNNQAKRLTTKWNVKKRSLRGSTIYGNHRQFYKAKLGLNHLNNTELKKHLKKQMGEMLQLTTKNKYMAEKNESSKSSKSPKNVLNPMLNRSNSPPVKTRLLVTRKKPRPWTKTRRSELKKRNPTFYSEQQERLNREK